MKCLRSKTALNVARGAEYFAKVATVVSIVFSAYSYVSEAPQRQEQSYREAWQVLDLAAGHNYEGGRVAAIKTLADGKQPLNGLDLAGAELPELSLPAGTLLSQAHFDGARLTGPDFSGSRVAETTFARKDGRNTDLDDARLVKSTLVADDFTDAWLVNARFDNSTMWMSVFDGANLNSAKFDGATIVSPMFKNACLQHASFKGSRFLPDLVPSPTATFPPSSFSGSDLSWTDFQDLKVRDQEGFILALSRATSLRHIVVSPELEPVVHRLPAYTNPTKAAVKCG